MAARGISCNWSDWSHFQSHSPIFSRHGISVLLKEIDTNAKADLIRRCQKWGERNNDLKIYKNGRYMIRKLAADDDSGEKGNRITG